MPLSMPKSAPACDAADAAVGYGDGVPLKLVPATSETRCLEVAVAFAAARPPAEGIGRFTSDAGGIFLGEFGGKFAFPMAVAQLKRWFGSVR